MAISQRSPKRQRLITNGHDAHGESLGAAVAAITTKLNTTAPQASALYHLAYVKAFVQIACRFSDRSYSVDVQKLLEALNEAMVYSNAMQPEEPAASIQVYTLKELRRFYSLDEIMHALSSGELGVRLPSLKQRCASAVALPTASKLGFDPFATYGDDYRAARRNLQLGADGQAPQEVSEPRMTLFAIATALYLPRSLLATTATDVAAEAADRCIPGAQRRNTPIARLARALAANQLNVTQMVLRPQTQRLHAFASSLAVHLAAVLDAADPATNPFALYTKQPAQCA